jgi:hypothetical protein
MAIIVGYSWLFYCKPLVVILLVAINGYYIGDDYWRLFHYKLLLNILGYITLTFSGQESNCQFDFLPFFHP